jgi:hypothetical protein
LVEQGLERPLPGGIVGRAVLPAVPDDEEPGAGEDADGVGVVVAPGPGAVVEVVGPGAGAAGVAGEVGDGVAELLTGESRSANSPTAPGKTFARWARSWFATATRWLTRSLRARQARRSAMVAGGVAADLAAVGIDGRHSMVITSPVNAGCHAAGRFLGKGNSGRLQACLLAARPSREAPSFRAMTWRHHGCISNPSKIADTRMVHQ